MVGNWPGKLMGASKLRVYFFLAHLSSHFPLQRPTVQVTRSGNRAIVENKSPLSKLNKTLTGTGDRRKW